MFESFAIRTHIITLLNVFQVAQSLIASQFLEDNGSQLTYHGLCELNTTLKDGELAVLFRNNHFSAILKRRTVSSSTHYINYYIH